jgi:hypothetical protein
MLLPDRVQLTVRGSGTDPEVQTRMPLCIAYNPRVFLHMHMLYNCHTPAMLSPFFGL